MKKRKIHIDEEEWIYRIGRQFIVIWSPNNNKYLTNLSEVSGLSWSNIERNIWKGNWKGIKPSEIKKYIESNYIDD